MPGSSTPEDRLWNRLWTELDSIKATLDRRVDYRRFDEFKQEINDDLDELRKDIQQLKHAAITPDHVSKMIGEGLNKSEARGLTARDRYIRYGAFAISLLTFILLVISQLKGAGT